MRFTIETTALISDVEKAFLQIRLHQSDREATRFLWLRDIGQPVEPDNIITYRFSRVTFGVNCSPFLLAGTIKHHLENSVKDRELEKNISDKTYVDNVIVTAPCTKDSIRLYMNSKHPFKNSI